MNDKIKAVSNRRWKERLRKSVCCYCGREIEIYWCKETGPEFDGYCCLGEYYMLKGISKWKARVMFWLNVIYYYARLPFAFVKNRLS